MTYVTVGNGQERNSSPGRVLRAGTGLALAVLLLVAGPVGAQTISGTLRDADTNQPIELGLVLMYTEAGDSITAAVSGSDGRFTLASPTPGDFVLLGAAFGYEETRAGVFELGTDGAMSIEYRLPPAPFPIDEIVVAIDRPVLEHHLVRNGFVRRLQRGLGDFITPYDIERSPALSTEDLLVGIPNVRVATIKDTVGVPTPLGEMVQLVGPNMMWCSPTVYVDGVRALYRPRYGFNLTGLANRRDVEAIEVYRRAASMPVEFSAGDRTECGVIVMWTKQGLGRGQYAASDPSNFRFDPPDELPDVDRTGPPPEAGESIRVALAPDAPTSGIRSPWQGTYLTSEAGALVARDDQDGRLITIPIGSVVRMQVSRLGDPGGRLRRGLLAGAIGGFGTAGFLRILCEATCMGGPDVAEIAGPSVAVGLVVGAIMGLRAPGNEWVATPVPTFGRQGGSDVGLGLRIPHG